MFCYVDYSIAVNLKNTHQRITEILPFDLNRFLNFATLSKIQNAAAKM